MNGFYLNGVFYMEKICEKCGLPFIVPSKNKNHPNRFCSRDCLTLARRGNKKDLKTPHNKHILLYIGRNEHGKEKRVYEHRKVFEENIRPLQKGEIVHHLDDNKQNNVPENLEALESQAEHLARHNYFIERRKPELTPEQEKQLINDFDEFGF